MPPPLKDLERFRLAFERTSISIALIDPNGNIFEANPAFCDLFGYSIDELRLMNLSDIWLAEDQVEAMADFRKAAQGRDANSFVERKCRNKNGEILFVAVERNLVRSHDGKPDFIVASYRDMTEHKRLQALLEERASTDPLTGAMNRNGIEEKVRNELTRSDRYGDKLSLVLIDLDHFKAVNDTYGHVAGDRVLQGFCDIVRSCLRSTDFLGRVGGEEFVALLSETGLTGARLFAERLRTTLEEFPFTGGIRITASMGIAGHREGEELSSLMERADSSLYRAKQAGRNCVVLDREDVQRAAAGKTQGGHLTLHWKPAYLTGQPLIDAEHEESFRLINLMMIAMAEEEAENRVLPLVRRVLKHIQTHFTNEEQLLRASGFPDADAHAAIHRNLLARAYELTDQYELRQDSAADLLGFLIHDVAASHMLRDDRKFFPWLKAKQA